MNPVMILLLLAVIGGGFVLLLKTDPKTLAKGLHSWGGIGLLALSGLLAATGRMAFAAPLAAVGLYLFRNGSSGAKPASGSPRSAGRTSAVRSATIEMKLDHDSGDISGSVLTGRFAKRQLADLSRAELMQLLADCEMDDAEGAQLLERYLDVRFADWRDRRTGEGGENQPMGRDRALDILGFANGSRPTKTDIIRAHHQLMKKLHPDHGGSSTLAALINEARDYLLK